MLGPALQQLLEDLSRVTDRTSYEEALYSELSGLAGIFGADRTQAGQTGLVEDRTFQITIAGEGEEVLDLGSYQLGQAAGYLHLDRVGVRSVDLIDPQAVVVDLGESDVRRLRCNYRDCPNKRM